MRNETINNLVLSETEIALKEVDGFNESLKNLREPYEKLVQKLESYINPISLEKDGMYTIDDITKQLSPEGIPLEIDSIFKIGNDIERREKIKSLKIELNSIRIRIETYLKILNKNDLKEKNKIISLL